MLVNKSLNVLVYDSEKNKAKRGWTTDFRSSNLFHCEPCGHVFMYHSLCLSHSQTNNCSLGMKQLPHNSSAKERRKLHSLHLQFCGNSVNLRSKRPRRRRDAYHKFIAQDSRLFPKSPKSASLTHKLSSRIICVSCVTQRVIVNDLARCISSNELQLIVGTIQLLEDIAWQECIRTGGLSKSMYM